MGVVFLRVYFFIRAQKLDFSPLFIVVLACSLLLGLGASSWLKMDATGRVEASVMGPQMVGQLRGKKIPQTQGYIDDGSLTVSQPVPVYWQIPTNQPVIFLGIDDGWVKSPEASQWLKTHQLPFTLFLTDQAVGGDYDYFKDLQSSGVNIQNHTLTHPDLAKLNYDQQKSEICGQSDKLQAIFGKRPTLFRPPYGSYNDITRQVVADCGMKAMILWHAKADGGYLQFQDVNHFEPGDIILMHFRPMFLADMQAFMDEVNRQHFSVGSLEDWVQ